MDKKSAYIVLFRGIKLSRREANRTGLAIIFGFIGIFMSIFVAGSKNRTMGFLIVIILAGIGYLLGNKIFKNRYGEQG